MCGHVTNVIWYLSFGRYQNSLKGVRNWTASLEDASDIPAIIDESDSDEDEGCVEEWEKKEESKKEVVLCMRERERDNMFGIGVPQWFELLLPG